MAGASDFRRAALNGGVGRRLAFLPSVFSNQALFLTGGIPATPQMQRALRSRRGRGCSARRAENSRCACRCAITPRNEQKIGFAAACSAQDLDVFASDQRLAAGEGVAQGRSPARSFHARCFHVAWLADVAEICDSMTSPQGACFAGNPQRMRSFSAPDSGCFHACIDARRITQQERPIRDEFIWQNRNQPRGSAVEKNSGQARLLIVERTLIQNAHFVLRRD